MYTAKVYVVNKLKIKTNMSAPIGEASSGSGAGMKAAGIGFLVLILANGNMQPNAQLALVVGVIAYVVLSRKAASGAH